MYVLTCTECHYQRSSEDDGRMFDEDDDGNLVCSECRPRGESVMDGVFLDGK